MRRGTTRKATPTRRASGSSARRAVAGGLSSVLLLGGCGGKDEQASEERIQRERAEAAVIAKQDERIKQLQREQRDLRRGSTRPPPVAERTPNQGKSDSSSGASSRPSDDWPGGSAYTTILASKGSESEAQRIQAAASGRGLDAGVLYSTNYRSLRPGYWVVFSGTSSSKQDADRRTARAKALGYGGAYPRFVSG